MTIFCNIKWLGGAVTQCMSSRPRGQEPGACTSDPAHPVTASRVIKKRARLSSGAMAIAYGFSAGLFLLLQDLVGLAF